MRSLRDQVPLRRLLSAAVGLAWSGTIASCLLYVALSRGVTADSPFGGWALIATGAGIAAAGAAAMVPLVEDRAQRRVERTVRTTLLDRILSADTASERADLPSSGRLVSTGTDGAAKIAALRGSFSAALVGAGTSPLIVLAVIGLVIDWLVAALLLLLIILALVAVGVFGHQFRHISAGYRAQSRRLAGEFLDALRGLKTVSLFGQTAREAARLDEESERQRRSVMRLLLGNQIVLLIVDVFFYGGVIGGATAMGVSLGITGRLGPGDVVALVLLALLLTAPLDYIGQFFYIGMTGRAAEREAAGLIGPSAPPSRPAAPAIRSTGVSCSLRDVHLTYPDRTGPVLSGLSIAIAAGETVALVGPSGSGKSTVLALLSGDLRPDTGEIEFDGAVADPRRHTAVMHQDTHLFIGSIAHNLRLALPEASDSDLWSALDRAHLGDEIRELPLGLDTPVGEFGASLSGGQRQRLSLARALLRDAPVLILDEPTSHIDAHSESLISQTIAAEAGQKTVVLASHSTELLHLADRIIHIGDTRDRT